MTTRESLAHALIIAGLFLGASFALSLLSPDHLSRELARRLAGALTGVVLVVYANAMPKTLSPLARMRCDPAAEQAMRRFAGWALTLGGSAYVAAWLAAPIDRANLIAAGFLGTSVLLVAGRLTWSIARKSRA